MTGKHGQRYPAEMKQRAVRMVAEHKDDYRSEWQAIQSIAGKLDVHAETLRGWVRRAEIDSGERDGVTSDQHAENKRLKKENAELRRANEILKAAAHFFGAELDRQHK